MSSIGYVKDLLRAMILSPSEALEIEQAVRQRVRGQSYNTQPSPRIPMEVGYQPGLGWYAELPGIAKVEGKLGFGEAVNALMDVLRLRDGVVSGVGPVHDPDGTVTLTRAEIAVMLEQEAQARFGRSAEEYISKYRKGQLGAAGREVARGLLVLASLLPKDDPLHVDL